MAKSSPSIIKVEAVVEVPTPPKTITISGLSEKLAEKLMAAVGITLDEDSGDFLRLYEELGKALGKGLYGASSYQVHGNNDDCRALSVIRFRKSA